MAKRVYCIVTNVIEGASFGVREDNDDSIYIPAKLSDRLSLEAMDRLQGVVVRNTTVAEAARTPWVMIRAMHVDDEGNPIEIEVEEC